MPKVTTATRAQASVYSKTFSGSAAAGLPRPDGVRAAEVGGSIAFDLRFLAHRRIWESLGRPPAATDTPAESAAIGRYSNVCVRPLRRWRTPTAAEGTKRATGVRQLSHQHFGKQTCSVAVSQVKERRRRDMAATKTSGHPADERSATAKSPARRWPVAARRRLSRWSPQPVE